MYRRFETDDTLKGKVKIIGIGAGNSAFEVGFFKKTFGIPFPLFPDYDFNIHQKLGDVRTPYYICIRKMADGGHQVFYSRVGGAKNADLLIKKLLQKSGLI
jgi:hypothetical protein